LPSRPQRGRDRYFFETQTFVDSRSAQRISLDTAATHDQIDGLRENPGAFGDTRRVFEHTPQMVGIWVHTHASKFSQWILPFQAERNDFEKFLKKAATPVKAR